MSGKSIAAYGLLVPLSAKEGEEDALADFLLGGYDLVQAEPDTAQWFAVKYPDVPNTFAIFDTFVAQSGRQAHLSGKLAEALMAKAPSLLSPAPQIDEVAVLASKVKSVVSKEKNAGLRVGLTVLLTAKPKQVEAVKDLLTSALPLVEAEPDTPVWYAVEFPGTDIFAVIDFFPDELGRNAHLGGKVAEALFANSDTFFVATPIVQKFTVVAAKVSRL